MIDKTKWPRGPWDDEPDHLEFEHCGLPCVVNRVTGPRHLCGYVGVPNSHRDYGADYDNAPNYECHGGLTYSAKNAPGCDKTGYWWFGFDCAHCDDVRPKESDDHGRYRHVASYRDVDYVRAEIMHLASQLTQPVKDES